MHETTAQQQQVLRPGASVQARVVEAANLFTGVRCATCGTGWHPRRSELLVSAGSRCPRCHGQLAR